MTTKEKVLEILQRNGSRFTSGQEMAEELFVTRAAIWKSINALRKGGYEIEAITNKGYRIFKGSTPINKDIILSILGVNERKKATEEAANKKNITQIFTYDVVESTNDIAKEYGEKLLGEDALFITQSQKKGKGRRGRSFFSPSGTGLYMSLLLYPDIETEKILGITCIMGVAVCLAIEEVTGIKTQIKWVNDIYYGDKKIAGILTEGITSVEEGCFKYVVVGVGLNIYEPYTGFPTELKDVAGALLLEVSSDNIREQLCGAIINNFYALLEDDAYIDEYRKRSMLIGKYVKIVKYVNNEQKGGNEYALVTGIDDSCHLMVRYDSGEEESLSTGEVSVVKY